MHEQLVFFCAGGHDEYMIINAFDRARKMALLFGKRVVGRQSQLDREWRDNAMVRLKHCSGNVYASIECIVVCVNLKVLYTRTSCSSTHRIAVFPCMQLVHL